MSYTLRDHTADVAVEATGSTLSAVFAAVADGLTAAMCDDVSDHGERFQFTVRAESRDALLFDYLDQLIYERDVRNVLPAEHDATVQQEDDSWVVTASARGVPLEAVDARDIKAVTYSEMDLSRVDDGWHAYVVFDV
jgi:SHS2 domain-containing protein